MDFVDSVLVRLGDPGARSSLFDDDALAAILAAGHDPELLGIEGPYSAVFDEIAIGPFVEPASAVRGSWQPLGGASVEVALRASGLRSEQAPVEALWRGSVVARSRRGGEPVTGLALDWDAGPPGDHRAGVTVTYAPPREVEAAARPIAVAVALLVRPAGASLTELLRTSARVRHDLAESGFGAAPDPDRPQRHPVVVAWVLPETVFDDDAWPGGTAAMDAAARRAARRARAGAWLSTTGLALVPIPA
ncbi:hypothetical protein [Modestobacter lapidis]|nr:hypothetical protein [Modestobacter lapidis]